MRRRRSLLGEIAYDMLKSALGGSKPSNIGTSFNTNGNPHLERIREIEQDQQVKREILLAQADGSAYAGGNQKEQMILEEVVRDYNEFDVEFAKGCVKTISDLMANAFKDHPSDYSMFEKLCTKQAVAKIRRFVTTSRIVWYEYSVADVQVIRYNPNPINPTVVIKANLSFEPQEKYKGFFRYSFFYTCIEGAKTCTHCGGIIEDQLIDKCPYCDYIVTDSATEKAWKITDVRQLT